MRWPDWLDVLVLALATYRLTRLGGWDDFPPIYRMRAWLIGEYWVRLEGPEGDRSISGSYRDQAEAELGLPGKQPTSEAAEVRPAYSRPLLAHLVHCPFCLGWWVSLATLAWWLGVAWAASRGWATGVLAPFALSGAVGLISKNLDA